MSITNLNEFLESYFISHHCKINSNKDGILTVQLTEEMDKKLMNRPFYWHYIKGAGNNGEPMQLTLVTNPEKRSHKGEWLHFGSARLQQVFNHLKENERYIRLFQEINTHQQTPLHPWLLTNMKVSYQGKQKKEELFSVGLNLITGMMKLEMMKLLRDIPLNSSISNYCYSLSPLIKLHSGFLRIERIIEDYVQRQPHNWAMESIKLLKEEIQLVEQFYNPTLNQDQLVSEVSEITERYSPRIRFEVINGGIIYLTTEFN